MSKILTKKIFVFTIFLFIIIFLLTYRDFLNTLKFFLFHEYNFKMLPMDNYYKILLDYDRGDFDSIGWPWSNRVVPNYINFIYYKYFPCPEVSVIPESINSNIYCSMFAVSLMNQIFTILSLILVLYYLKFELKRDFDESIFGFCIYYFFLQFLDRFGVDRFSIFFLLLFVLTINSYLWLRILIIFISIWVNDKCLIFISVYYFILLIENYLSKKKFSYILENLSSGISLIFYIFFIFSFEKYKNDTSVPMNYGDNFSIFIDYFLNFFSFHALSNSIIQVTIIVVPFILLFKNKIILTQFKVNKLYLIMILVYLILGISIGGTGNFGRYMIYISPVTFPLFNYLLFSYIKKKLD